MWEIWFMLYTRLLELAGLPLLILEALTPSQAERIFRFHGATDADFVDAKSLQRARNRLMKLHHSDVSGGGNDDAAKEINSAYDTLKVGGSKSSSSSTRPSASSYRPEPEPRETPPWQTDERSRYNRINRQNFTDMNYFMQQMWELSGHSRKKYNILAYDGSYFRSSITVFGSDKIFYEMAQAMRVWNSHGGNPYRTEAVFVSTRGSKVLKCIYNDGAFYEVDPPEIEHDSFNDNASNDQQFMRRLPQWLAQIEDGRIDKDDDGNWS